MDLQAHVLNGVVVLDENVLLPEGAAVTVTPHSDPVIRIAKNQKRVEFPLVRSSAAGSLQLTNERIAEILEQEDAEAVKRSWDVSS